MAERLYTLRGKTFTASQVAELDDVTVEEKRQFALQAGLSDQRLKEIEALMAAMAPPIRDFVEKAMRPLVDRLQELEARPAITYEKTFTADRTYKPGNLVTHQGSLWHANIETRGIVPGEGNIAFSLVAKRGKDGKDATR